MSDHVIDTTATPLERIRAKRREAAKNMWTDIAVPGYDGELVVRYRLLDPLVEGTEIATRISKQFKGDDLATQRLYYAMVDSLIAACVGVYAIVDGAPVPLAGEGTTTTFEDTTSLAELLGFDEKPSARETLEEVFVGRRIAVDGQAQRLQRWMADPSAVLNEGIFG